MALKKKLEFPTRFNQNRPFMLGGRSFFSKRLNGEEEIEVQRIQLLAQSESDTETSAQELGFIADLLTFRSTNSETVSVEWLGDRLCKMQGVSLLSYLRTGEGLKPGETFDIPEFEGFDIEDRKFTGLALSYREAVRVQTVSAEGGKAEITSAGQELVRGANAAQAEADANEDLEADENLGERVREMVARGLELHEQARELTRSLSRAVAEILNARRTEGEEITGEWLMMTVNESFIGQVLAFLTNGEYDDGELDLDGEGQGDTKNAEPVPVIA